MQNAYWIVMLPFLAGAFIVIAPFLFPQISRDSRGWKLFSMALSIGAVTWGLIHSLCVVSELANTGGRPYVVDVPWFTSASFTLTMGLLLDNLTGVMFIFVKKLIFLVQI
jgi:NADH:ubiquinone oxidoreductase subunit 5 (subunit L)/multisubunit Na+/H+ antiporter MnhA subunit